MRDPIMDSWAVIAAALFVCSGRIGQVPCSTERAMYNPFALTLLALEAQKVVELRLVKLAWGGAEGRMEAHRMVSEKISAFVEASDTLMNGGSADVIIARYREYVAANTRRLTAT